MKRIAVLIIVVLMFISTVVFCFAKEEDPPRANQIIIENTMEK